MATFRLPHFSSPEILRAVDRRRLIAFFEPHRAFFHARGVELPAAGSDAEPDHEALAAVFLSPDERTPRDLIDALYYVDGMATPAAMADLIESARAAGVPLDAADDVSPADLAVQVWLRAPDLLERRHAEQFLRNPKSFDHFSTADPDAGVFVPPSAEAYRRLEESLNDWFEQKKRGRTAKVFVPPEAREALDAYLAAAEDRGPLFPSRAGVRLARQHVDRLLKQLVAQANSRLPATEQIRLSPHVLRHTFLRKVTQKHGVEFAMEAAGHASSKYIWRYVRPSEEQKEAALEDLF